jgi:hypothetical protein
MTLYRVTWLEAKSADINVQTVDDAATYAVEHMGRLGGFPAARLLSILPVEEKIDPKPPTPFGAPPGGTLGGGQVKTKGTLPHVVAA